MISLKTLFIGLLAASFLSLTACTNKSDDEKRPLTAAELKARQATDKPAEDAPATDTAAPAPAPVVSGDAGAVASTTTSAPAPAPVVSGDAGAVASTTTAAPALAPAPVVSGDAGAVASTTTAAAPIEAPAKAEKTPEEQDKDELNFFYCAAKDLKIDHAALEVEAQKNGLAGVCFELSKALELRESFMNHTQVVGRFDPDVTRRLNTIIQDERTKNGMLEYLEDICFEKQPRKNVRLGADGKTKISDADEAKFLSVFVSNIKSWNVLLDAALLEGKNLYKNVVKTDIQDSDCQLPDAQRTLPTDPKELNKTHLINLYCLAGSVIQPSAGKIPAIDIAFEHFKAFKFGACHTLGKSADAREQMNAEIENLKVASPAMYAQLDSVRTAMKQQGMLDDLDSLCKEKRPLKKDASSGQMVLDEASMESIIGKTQLVYSSAYVPAVQRAASSALLSDHGLKADDATCGGLSDEEKAAQAKARAQAEAAANGGTPPPADSTGGDTTQRVQQFINKASTSFKQFMSRFTE